MKRISFLLVILLMVGRMAMAQGPRRGGQNLDPKEHAKRVTERMVKEYPLNEIQEKQLSETNVALVEKMGTHPGKMKPGMRQGKEGQSQATDSCTCKQDKREAPRMSKGDREKMRQEVKVSRETYDASLEKIITKEQYEVYTKQKAERGPKRGSRK